ncbi:MAG: DUF1837 domain-containing protein [Candidatus Marinimicrobia bacterium]|nr:DUF1837 domain-containing protein [Candidatus Neomarinimicrobiota bacterium]
MITNEESTGFNNTNQSGLRADREFLKYIEIPLEKKFSSKIKGKFLLIKYKYDKNREEEFTEFILDNLMNYALSKKERESLKSDPIKKARKLWLIAIRRYVKKSKKFKGGEIGELILFHLLEVVEQAVQIVNKMFLKTSGNMHFHGADAVHFGVDGDLRILFLGESKTGQKFSQVLTDAIKKVNEYCNEEKQTFEVDLAVGHISEDIPEELRQEIKNYLDPSKDDLSNFTETHAIFLGFEYKILKELENEHSGKELISKVIETYRSEIEGYIHRIEEKISEYPNLQNRRFLFYLLPFKDLNSIRNKVLEEIKNVK